MTNALNIVADNTICPSKVLAPEIINGKIKPTMSHTFMSNIVSFFMGQK